MKSFLAVLMLLVVLLVTTLAFATPSQVDVLLAGLTDSSGNALASGKVYTYTAGTTSNKTTWADLAESTPQANPIVLDSNGRKQVFADGLYKFVVKDSLDNTLYTWDNLSYGNVSNVPLYGGTSSGAANVYAITVAPNPVSYVTGQKFSFLSHQANTTAATINVNGIGSKSIVSTTNQALVGGEIQSGATIEVLYDGTSFRIVRTTPLPKVGSAYAGSLISTSSGTPATMTTMSVTVSVKTGDYVKLNFWGTISTDNIDTACGFAFYEGSTQQANSVGQYRSTGDVSNGGILQPYAFSYIMTSPTAGSQTYTVKWERDAGANVCYSYYRYLSVEVVSP